MPEQTSPHRAAAGAVPPGCEACSAKWMPPASDAEPLALFRTLAVHAELMSRMRPLGAGILGARATVAPQLREIVIHRTCALTGAQYEWGVHALAFGAPLGLSEEQLRSTVHGHWGDACWQPAQAACSASPTSCTGRARSPTSSGRSSSLCSTTRRSSS